MSTLGLQIFVERNLEGKELLAVGATQFVQVHLGTFQRIVQPWQYVEEEAGAGGVRFHGEGLVLEGIEVLLSAYCDSCGGNGFRELEWGQEWGADRSWS